MQRAGNVRERIENELAAIEQAEGVRGIYAVESGSRAWGFPSRDSDYDVRFLYVRPVDAYLSIVPVRDVIEYPISDALDLNGWDFPKALSLFRKSNPSILERLHSSIIYLQIVSKPLIG
jgi:predicted nucleotidyltransferase